VPLQIQALKLPLVHIWYKIYFVKNANYDNTELGFTGDLQVAKGLSPVCYGTCEVLGIIVNLVVLENLGELHICSMGNYQLQSSCEKMRGTRLPEVQVSICSEFQDTSRLQSHKYLHQVSRHSFLILQTVRYS
jgi:hypothetical protein